jgi:hypothetical protein
MAALSSNRSVSEGKGIEDTLKMIMMAVKSETANEKPKIQG